MPQVQAAPLLTLRGVPVLLGVAVLLTWPMVLGAAAYVFADTPSYLNGGARIWDVLTSFAEAIARIGDGPVAASDDALADLSVNARGQSTTGRSFLYSFFAFATVSFGGAFALAVAQGFLVLLVAAALIGPEALARPKRLAAGTAFVVLASSLPWYADYVMPDVLAAVPILFGALLVSRFALLSRPQQVTVTAVTAFAAASHYGHGPLMFGIAALAVGVQLVRRSLTLSVILAALAVVAFAPLANVTASTAVLKETSLAPKRLPILLARSLEDGPARWYLEDACPEADLAFCEVFGDQVPSNVGMFLWTPEGIDDITPAQLDAIRAEEFTILRRAFLRYPVQQTVSLLGNSALQIVRVGLDEHRAAGPIGDDMQYRGPAGSTGAALIGAFDDILPWTTLLGALPLLALALAGRLDGVQLRILALTLAGLVLNALIFGGLSAPVDRYQARVIWVLPFLSALFLAAAEFRPAAAARGSAPRRSLRSSRPD